MKLTVATCQFPTSSNIPKNGRYIHKLMTSAASQGADVAHFPEACLSGYAGADIAGFEDFPWDLLKKCTGGILDLARQLHIWVILGSAHPLTPPNKPHNCLYIIDDQGKIAGRYDKMFCAGDAAGTTGDLAHYTPGQQFCVFEIRGIRCGALICHEYRYPELYRKYKRQGVQLMFHSYHAGHISAERYRKMQLQVGLENHRFNPGTTLPEITQPSAMISAAADNYMWISCPNSSARISCWGSFAVRPDGIICGKLKRHVTGVLVTRIDTDVPYYDSTAPWRDRAMNGIFHSGTAVESTIQ